MGRRYLPLDLSEDGGCAACGSAYGDVIDGMWSWGLGMALASMLSMYRGMYVRSAWD